MRRVRAAIALVIVAAVLVAGNAAAMGQDLPIPGTDQSAETARRTGGGFEFRRKISPIDNPYCAVATYVLPALPEQAASTRTGDDRQVIVVDASTLKSDPAYAHFLLAHECCHHTLGHTRLTLKPAGGVGVQPFFYLRPLLRNMELDADSCAVHMLKLTKEAEAIDRARTRMLTFGNLQTGAYYPTGVERADNILRADKED